MSGGPGARDHGRPGAPGRCCGTPRCPVSQVFRRGTLEWGVCPRAGPPRTRVEDGQLQPANSPFPDGASHWARTHGVGRRHFLSVPTCETSSDDVSTPAGPGGTGNASPRIPVTPAPRALTLSVPVGSGKTGQGAEGEALAAGGSPCRICLLPQARPPGRVCLFIGVCAVPWGLAHRAFVIY